MIRVFDILLSTLGIVFLFPFYIIISIFIVVDSKGGIVYNQKRVGKGSAEFNLFKFRTMRTGADKKGLLTVGGKDSRITKVGYYLRKFKLDESLQLFNVLFGQMSLVGPRPEVKKYVDLYTEEQRKVLSVRPGITDFASIEYANENEILEKAEHPEKMYIEEIMPHKITLNMKFINNYSIGNYLKVIYLTFGKIIKL